MGSVLKTGGFRDGLFVRLQNGKVQQAPVTLGSIGDDALTALLPTSSTQLLAVGWTQTGGTSSSQQAWVVGFAPDGTVQFNSKQGNGKADGFLGLVPFPGSPLAFGYQDDKGWIAEVKAGGGLGQDAKQSISAQNLRWTAGHSPDPSAKVIYLAGKLTESNGVQRVAVAALDTTTLSTKWLKVVGEGGEQPFAVAASAGGKGQVVIAGTQGSGALTAAWLVVLDGDGKALSISTEANAGPRAYLALIPGLQGDLVAVGGAEQLGVNPGELPSYGWFARWRQAKSRCSAR